MNVDTRMAKLATALEGVWGITGDANGEVAYELQEGGRFLIQHVDLVHGGRQIRGIELIGRTKGLDGAESEDIHSRFFSFLDGLTLDYIYELNGRELIIWGGSKGSPACYRGDLNDDGTVLTGGWQWPGGGYSTITTRFGRTDRPRNRLGQK